MHNRMLLISNTLLQHSYHFDCWNQPLNLLMRVCCLDCYEARLCRYLVIHIKIRHMYPCKRPWMSTELWDVEAPTFSRQSAHRWLWGCQVLRASHPLPPKDFWYSFLLEAESTPGPLCSWKD
jgi:hypothetical protein